MMSFSWVGPHWSEALESPHLAYICALRSFDFWLMASSSFTKAGLFRSCRVFLLRAALAPVATAGAAFHGHSRRPSRRGDREESAPVSLAMKHRSEGLQALLIRNTARSCSCRCCNFVFIELWIHSCQSMSQ